jgi:hypothetical protein
MVIWREAGEDMLKGSEAGEEMLIGREAGEGLRKYQVRYFWEVKCEACWELVKGRGHSFLDIEKQDLIPEMKKIGVSWREKEKQDLCNVSFV